MVYKTTLETNRVIKKVFVHAFAECDTISVLFEKEKASLCNTLKKSDNLILITKYNERPVSRTRTSWRNE